MEDEHFIENGEDAPAGLSVQVAREHLELLRVERELAREEGLGEIAAYVEDLEREIDAWEGAYVLAAVTEIASLRGELSGVQAG